MDYMWHWFFVFLGGFTQ